MKKFNVLNSAATRLAILFITDFVLATSSVFIAYILKFNFSLSPAVSNQSLLMATTHGISVLLFSYIYHNNFIMIRHYSIRSAFRQAYVTLSSGLLVFIYFVFSSLLTTQTLSALLLALLINYIAIVFVKLSYSLYRNKGCGFINSEKRVTIIGAGHAASLLLKDLQNQKSLGLNPVSILDDNLTLKGRLLHDIPIEGSTEELESIIEKHGVEMVIFAIPSVTNKQLINFISNICLEKGVELRRLPGLNDLVDNKVSINALRPVAIEDLLGRDPVNLDELMLEGQIENQTILITGGGGSIGSELCKQIAHFKPKKILILELTEYNLYSIDYELRCEHPESEVIPVLGSVADENLVDAIFEEHRPDWVFHAAAYKHVPMLEGQPLAAMKNNIRGTWVMAQAAIKYNAKKFILVSTDKAVNPTNIMGTTKRVAEIICQLLSQKSNVSFSIVRFGNVLDSVGSVLPRFSDQIKQGGPVTVTHPDITRYFMMIPEACQLILRASQMKESGKIFVLDMGDPIKIVDLAKKMIQLSGRVLGEDIEIEYVGLRPGEKLYEELFHETEVLNKTEEEKVFSTETRDVDWCKVEENLILLLDAVVQGESKKGIVLLESMVPEAILEKL